MTYWSIFIITWIPLFLFVVFDQWYLSLTEFVVLNIISILIILYILFKN